MFTFEEVLTRNHRWWTTPGSKDRETIFYDTKALIGGYDRDRIVSENGGNDAPIININRRVFSHNGQEGKVERVEDADGKPYLEVQHFYFDFFCDKKMAEYLKKVDWEANDMMCQIVNPDGKAYVMNADTTSWRLRCGRNGAYYNLTLELDLSGDEEKNGTSLFTNQGVLDSDMTSEEWGINELIKEDVFCVYILEHGIPNVSEDLLKTLSKHGYPIRNPKNKTNGIELLEKILNSSTEEEDNNCCWNHRAYDQ